jgi:sulfate transport system permease protein
MSMRFKSSGILPGFGLSMGFTLTYLSLIVLLPLSALLLKSMTLTWPQFVQEVTSPRVMASYRLTFGASFIAAIVNSIFGALVAWVLVRYEFFGKRIVDALVDLPFALPTAVAGITLTAIYAPNGFVGKLFQPFGISIAYTPLGITLALIFIGMPFVVRTLQPVLESLDPEIEKAALSLGASRWYTVTRVILPSLIPAWITGFSLSFARAVGEYGSVVFIAGNMPMKTEITPLLIITKLEQYDYPGATSIGLVMLLISFTLLLAINWIQEKAGQYRVIH